MVRSRRILVTRRQGLRSAVYAAAAAVSFAATAAQAEIFVTGSPDRVSDDGQVQHWLHGGQFTSNNTTPAIGTMISPINPTLTILPRVGHAVNNSGVAVASVSRTAGQFSATPILSAAPVRWGAPGGGILTVPDLPANHTTVQHHARATSINNAGVTIGVTSRHGTASNTLVQNAVRWGADGSGHVLLDSLQKHPTSGRGITEAFAINSQGTVVGRSEEYRVSNGGLIGDFAVMWDKSTTAVTRLNTPTLVNNVNGVYSEARGINDAGVVVGLGRIAFKSGNYSTPKGDNIAYSYSVERAMRWEPGSTMATMLNTIPSHNMSGQTQLVSRASAHAVNASGTAVGFSDLISENRDNHGQLVNRIALRWDAGQSDPTILQSLHSNPDAGVSRAIAVNSGGTAAGYSTLVVNSNNFGVRAVRWDSPVSNGRVVATQLGHLGTNSSGVTESRAFDLNDAGTAIGYAQVHGVAGIPHNAVIWRGDLPANDPGATLNLNSLGVVAGDNGGTWTLLTAKSLSADGWTAGEGTFTATGGNAISRHWVGQVGLGGRWLNTTGAGDTAWGRGPNWSSGTPAIQLDANFDADAAYTVTFDRDERARNVTVSAGHVTLANHGRTLTVKNRLPGASASDPGRFTVASAAAATAGGRLVADVANHGTFGVATTGLTLDGSLTGTGRLLFTLDATTPTNPSSSPLLTLSGPGGYSLATVKVVLDGLSPASGDTFRLLGFSNNASADFSGLGFDFTGASLVSGLFWDTSLFTTSGLLTVGGTPVAIPTPAAAGGGLAMLAVTALRRRRRA